MENMNVFDMLCEAVETYNDYIIRTNGSNVTCEVKRGLFYNFLKNKIGSFGGNKRSHASLLVKDLICTFDVDGRITGLDIHKNFSSGWGDEIEEVRTHLLNRLKSLVRKNPIIYPMKTLNEMSLIINSIN